MGAGLGIMIGTKSVKDTLDGDYAEQAKSNIGSEQGKVSIQAGDTVHVTSSDIVADTGIAISGQDVNDYTSNTKTAGLNLSLAPHMAPILSGSLGRQTIDSQYKSVIEQAGIYAGDSGLSATVGNTTQLRGAIIDAKGSSHLKTKNLDVQDIQNEATYHTSGRNSGFSSSLKDLPKAALQTIPSMAIPVQGQADSVTRSAIAESVIIEAEHSNRETISSDTQRALNQLKPIFDKKSVEERMELTTIIARNGAKLIGDIAAKKAWDAQVKALQETDPVKRAKYEREVKQWSEGGVNKIALHSVLGGFVSSLAGGTISTGALSAGANEALQGQLGKIEDPNIHRLASAMIGRVVTQSATGGAIAENATTHNYLTHKQIEQRRKELAAAQTEEERKAIKARWDAVDRLQENTYRSEVNRLEDKYIKDDIDEIEPDKYIPLKRELEQLRKDLDYVSLKSEDFFDEGKDLVVSGRRIRANAHGSILHDLYRDFTAMNVNTAKAAVNNQGYKEGTKEYDDALLKKYKEVKTGALDVLALINPDIVIGGVIEKSLTVSDKLGLTKQVLLRVYVYNHGGTIIKAPNGVKVIKGGTSSADISNGSRTSAENLYEQLALKSFLSNPLSGAKIIKKIRMTDPRWPEREGWVKMSNNINGVEIHFVYNTIYKFVTDIKIKF